MRITLFSLILSVFYTINISAANIAVVQGETKYPSMNVDRTVKTFEILGHQATKFPAPWLYRAMDLIDYDCIVLVNRSGMLTEKEYKVLCEYVSDGGTLLLIGSAADWMKTPGASRPKARISGEGPLKETAGVKMVGYREVAIDKISVVDVEDPASKGLPENFTMLTTPVYNVNDPASWRRVGAYPLKAITAKTLMKVETIDKNGSTAESDFLTVKQYGQGECYRLALSSIAAAIYEKREQHIARIINNILNISEKLDK